jgi:hypothetical protein
LICTRLERLIVLALAALSAAFIVGWDRAAAGSSSLDWDPKPRLELDLKTVGYLPRVLKNTLPNREFFKRFSPSVDPSIFERYNPTPVFVDEKTVAICWVRPEYADSKDEQDARAVPNGVRFHVALIDVAAGGLIAKREFPTAFRRWFNRFYDSQSTLTPLGGGRFLIHADNRLMLFNREFQLLHERDLPAAPRMGESGGFIVIPGGSTKGYSEMWAVFVSSGGRTLVLQHKLEDRYFLEWLNAEDLTTARSGEAPTGLVAVSDKVVTYGWFGSIRALSEDGDPREVCSPFCEVGLWEFLDAEQLLVPRQRSFFVYSLNGDILWSRQGRFKGNGIPFGIPSYEGNRFVVPVSAAHHGVFGEAELKKGENFLVYDARHRKLIFQAHLAKGVAEAALSPHGNVLALLAEEKIAVYELLASD